MQSVHTMVCVAKVKYLLMRAEMVWMEIQRENPCCGSRCYHSSKDV